jgi:hypothetical protein
VVTFLLSDQELAVEGNVCAGEESVQGIGGVQKEQPNGTRQS